MTNLEDYFNILSPNDIRLKNSRIGIETLLYEYIYRAKNPEDIAQLYPSLTLEQIYATILYYLHNKETITNYMTNWLEYCLKSAKEQDENPPEHLLKLRQLKAERTTKISNINEYSVSTR
ncbi:DUF433 domain-containing protein [Crocosphaera sp. XPORK-15E]|uniref:DUF433 domain-containing protein n=1 Tax=Crocosphaera sp. XPORK-15E TaxID=3110247 RepID=UPI002B21FF41|nr:DUF433 domain-containing protein [Crocosphaera sp. XPORK-15E]MEA5536817.1 DUF433 domain-containing protein [Crocosphaera sp. XPORK-15E]